MKLKKKYDMEAFMADCKEIESSTPIDFNETAAQKEKRIDKLKKDYKAFFEYYFPKFAKYPTAQFHVKLANAVRDNKTFKGILEAFRGSAKSTHADLGIPIWLMMQDELKCMLLVGQTADKANRLLAGLQAQLTSNKRLVHDFGEQHQHGNWANGEFVTKTNVAFYAIGFKQDPRGTRNEENRPDYIIVDDCDSKRLSKNPKLAKEAVEWITEDLMGCFDVGRERFLLLNNRVSKNGILARLYKLMIDDKPKEHKWWHMQVNAIDKNGKPSWPEKNTLAYWLNKKAQMTYRGWESEYMNNPIEDGSIFLETWIKWKKILPLKDYDRLVVYVDPSFKHSTHSDYKAVKFWGRKGKEFHLIDAWVRQESINSMVHYMYDLYEGLPKNVIVNFYMEANFLQDMIFQAFEEVGIDRNYQLPISPDKRNKPDKFSRIEATSVYYERGFVYYNEDKRHDADFITAVEQLIAFEKGSTANDDSPDADEGAIYILNNEYRRSSAEVIIGERESNSSW